MNYNKMMSVGVCESCGKVLDHAEMQLKGIISGVELGLCRTHAREVNDMVRFFDKRYQIKQQAEYDSNQPKTIGFSDDSQICDSYL